MSASRRSASLVVFTANSIRFSARLTACFSLARCLRSPQPPGSREPFPPPDRPAYVPPLGPGFGFRAGTSSAVRSRSREEVPPGLDVVLGEDLASAAPAQRLVLVVEPAVVAENSVRLKRRSTTIGRARRPQPCRHAAARWYLWCPRLREALRSAQALEVGRGYPELSDYTHRGEQAGVDSLVHGCYRDLELGGHLSHREKWRTQNGPTRVALSCISLHFWPSPVRLRRLCFRPLALFGTLLQRSLCGLRSRRPQVRMVKGASRWSPPRDDELGHAMILSFPTSRLRTTKRPSAAPSSLNTVVATPLRFITWVNLGSASFTWGACSDRYLAGDDS